ncbi:hypothetical protein DEAC_c14190 [Desulfosporosinus acididurans]|uniref:Uncharacterized protein n=1 Tax=Desulfosporosinus acididurans TaxID=476652 RepID=A0A0J1IPY1_9FIRM|nr:hypothetical protein [Desulfosporosinus acididurans]KLU66751.1 hypothetical protein DEAC_c14190 [Desulfosporosinus acididurans]
MAGTKEAEAKSPTPVKDQLATELTQKDNVIIVKANRRLTQDENDLLIKRMEEQEKRIGMKILVIPYSVDIQESDNKVE